MDGYGIWSAKMKRELAPIWWRSENLGYTIPEGEAGSWQKCKRATSRLSILSDAAVLFTDADGMIRLSNECLVAAGQR
jgi:hypothetical protein